MPKPPHADNLHHGLDDIMNDTSESALSPPLTRIVQGVQVETPHTGQQIH